MILLQTLPGWPAAQEPSVMAILMLLFIIPAAVALLFWVVGMAGRWIKHDPATPSRELDVRP